MCFFVLAATSLDSLLWVFVSRCRHCVAGLDLGLLFGLWGYFWAVGFCCWGVMILVESFS